MMVSLSVQLIFIVLLVAFNIEYGSQKQIIDLTWDFEEKSIYWPGALQFNFTKKIASSRRGFWYASNEFQAAEHGGTHLDAPYHFDKEGWKVSDIPIQRFFANAIMVDLSAKVETGGPDYTVDKKLLEDKLKAFEPIQNNTVLLIKYGWSKYWPDKAKYLRPDDEGLHFPGLSNNSATLIANDGRFVGIAVDTASGDAGYSKNFEVHRILLGKRLYILENTKMTENIPDKTFSLVVAPMKLMEGTGAPVRIFAVIN
ncbi:kynurenine formamidase-like [Harmonia axyridis]|uniref:kynurenine formamidase-like n=1 Tax=Harmonia axyridis TaxID=115357 RepID=UPI001E279064|nr:kynurenine formamidase-like [Harmonia axyridis]